MVIIRQNKETKMIMHANSPTLRAAKLKGFTVMPQETSDSNSQELVQTYKSPVGL